MTSVETMRFFICGFLVGGFLEAVRLVWAIRKGKTMTEGDAMFLTILFLLSATQFALSVYRD